MIRILARVFVFCVIAVFNSITPEHAAAQTTRIVSLAPNITEILFALNVGPQIVGVTKQCNFPAEAKQKTIVGDMIRPSLETIISLKPTTVFATETTPRETIAALQKHGIEVVDIAPKRVTEVAAAIELIGKKLGASGKAALIATDIRAALAELDEKSQIRKKSAARKAVVLLQISPAIAAGIDTWLGNILERAGFVNIAAKQRLPWPQLSREFLLAEKPDYVFFDAMAFGGSSSESQIKESMQRLWNSTASAPKTVMLPADILMRPGPRLAQGLRFLVENP